MYVVVVLSPVPIISHHTCITYLCVGFYYVVVVLLHTCTYSTSNITSYLWSTHVGFYYLVVVL